MCAQHAKYFNIINRDCCPREAFLADLCEEIATHQESGSHIVLMLDANEDMRHGHMVNRLSSLHLQEAIIQRHGSNAPSTYRWNTTDAPIDGIWTSIGLEINAGGYFEMDEVIPGTDHKCLWIDVCYSYAFGHLGTNPLSNLQHED